MRRPSGPERGRTGLVDADLAAATAAAAFADSSPLQTPHELPVGCPGRKCRYTYIAEAVGVERGHTGLVKVDLAATTPAAAIAGRLAHGPGWMGGEATFVPRSQDPAGAQGCASSARPACLWHVTLQSRVGCMRSPHGGNVPAVGKSDDAVARGESAR